MNEYLIQKKHLKQQRQRDHVELALYLGENVLIIGCKRIPNALQTWSPRNLPIDKGTDGKIKYVNGAILFYTWEGDGGSVVERFRGYQFHRIVFAEESYLGRAHLLALFGNPEIITGDHDLRLPEEEFVFKDKWDKIQKMLADKTRLYKGKLLCR